MKATIEKEWTTAAGYQAKVVAQLMGHRCGYVTVPEDHPCYGKGYDEVDVCVHGGLTFSDGGKFGFDCAHWDDARDESIMSDEMKKVYADWPRLNEHGTVKTLEFCVAECESLAKQLKEQTC